MLAFLPSVQCLLLVGFGTNKLRLSVHLQATVIPDINPCYWDYIPTSCYNELQPVAAMTPGYAS